MASIKKSPEARERQIKIYKVIKSCRSQHRVIVFTKGLNNTTDEQMEKALEL